MNDAPTAQDGGATIIAGQALVIDPLAGGMSIEPMGPLRPTTSACDVISLFDTI
jgi:hypothetical protein